VHASNFRGYVAASGCAAAAGEDGWALYLINIPGGVFAIGIVPAMLLVPGNAAATAHNIVANEFLYRLSITVHLIVVLTNVPLAAIFYELFKYQHRLLATQVAVFTLVATAVETSGLVDQFAPVFLLTGSAYANAQALAQLPLTLRTISYDISTGFFAFYGICLGYLVFRSTFLPRVVGALLAIGACAYLVYGLSDMLAPVFAATLIPWILLPSLLGEGSLRLWLLIAGVNVERWSSVRSAHTGGDLGGTAHQRQRIGGHPTDLEL
jgi:hypothetical protein